MDHGDMSYLAIQIASGMEYLAQHQFIHRLNTLVFISTYFLPFLDTSNIYSSQYYYVPDIFHHFY